MKALTRILVLVATLLALATALSACELPGGLSDLIPGKATATEPASTTTAQKIVEPITPSVGLALVSHGNGTCYVSGIGTCTDTDIVIPSVSPAGDSVVGIGSNAFGNCSTLAAVMIPSSVTSIGSRAFQYCSSLTSITIPASVTSIGDYAFYNCGSLESITLPFVGATLNGTGNTHFGYIFGASSYSSNSSYVPKSLKTVVITGGTSIGSSAFRGCSSLTSITIPASVTSIDDDVFGYCSSLTTIEIPASVTSFGNYAFEYCRSLTTITIPASVTSIGDYAFYGCSSLTSIEIPASVTSIGDYAFEGCTSLTIYCETANQPSGWDSSWNDSCPVVWDCENNDVASDGYIYVVMGGVRYGLKDGVATVVRQPHNITVADIATSITYKGIEYPVTSIGDDAFDECTSLTTVTFAEGSQLTSIGDDAFYYCYSLTSITIPASVTSIGHGAFEYCYSLTSITIPSSVISIDERTFLNCSSLISVTFAVGSQLSSIGSNAFYNCNSLTSITIPASVTSIGDCAFYGCSSLTSITIPTSVTSIGSSAFYNCSSLTSVTFKNTTGWKVGSMALSSSALANKSTAATYLKSTYAGYDWTRN